MGDYGDPSDSARRRRLYYEPEQAKTASVDERRTVLNLISDPSIRVRHGTTDSKIRSEDAERNELFLES